MRVDREGVLFESPGVPPHYIIGRIRSTQQTASYCLVFKRICLAEQLNKSADSAMWSTVAYTFIYSLQRQSSRPTREKRDRRGQKKVKSNSNKKQVTST